MQYMLPISMEENALSQAEREHCYEESPQVARGLDAPGCFPVEARDREEAIAARIPGARWGTVEIRPVVEVPGLPGKPDRQYVGGRI